MIFVAFELSFLTIALLAFGYFVGRLTELIINKVHQ